MKTKTWMKTALSLNTASREKVRFLNLPRSKHSKLKKVSQIFIPPEMGEGKFYHVLEVVQTPVQR